MGSVPVFVDNAVGDPPSQALPHADRTLSELGGTLRVA